MVANAKWKWEQEQTRSAGEMEAKKENYKFVAISPDSHHLSSPTAVHCALH